MPLVKPLAQTRSTPPQAMPRRLDVRDLLGSEREAVIVHDGQEYRLRLTSNDKLILTK